MLDRVKTEMVKAMKEKRQPRVQALRNINAALQNAVKENPNSTDTELISVLDRLCKQRNDSFNQYSAAGRHDLANVEAMELKIIEEFLPKRLSVSELEVIASEIVKTEGATSMKDMGKIMGIMKSRLGSSATPTDISKVVKSLLS